MSGFEALTPNAPIVPPKYLSAAAAQVLPPSVDLKTPPPVVPIQYSRGRAAEPATATVRPPRKIPISRQVNPAKTVLSKTVCARPATGAASSATTQISDRRRSSTAASWRGAIGRWKRPHRRPLRKRILPLASPTGGAVGRRRCNRQRQGWKNSAMFDAVAASPGKLVSPSASAERRRVLWCWYSVVET